MSFELFVCVSETDRLMSLCLFVQFAGELGRGARDCGDNSVSGTALVHTAINCSLLFITCVHFFVTVEST